MKEIIEKIYEQKMSDGTFQKIVETEVEKMIQEAVRDALGWNSPVRKKMEEKIKNVMSNMFEQTNFDTYVDAFKIVIDSVLADSNLATYKQIASSLKELLGENTKAPREIKTSELFKKFCSCVENMSVSDDDEFDSRDDGCVGVNCVMNVEKEKYSSGSYKITFSIEKCDSDDYSDIFDKKYEFTLYLGSDNYGFINFGGKALLDLRYADEFMRYLMKLCAGYTHVVIDEFNGVEEYISVPIEY